MTNDEPTNDGHETIDRSFPQRCRLQKSADFKDIYQLRLSARDRHLLVFARRCPGQPTRIGLSVSRKHGGAVTRNRLKRLLREAFRLHRHKLPQELDLILIPQQGADATLEEFSHSLKKLVRKLHTRLDERPRPSSPTSDNPP